MGNLNPRSWCIRWVKRLGEMKVSTEASHFSSRCAVSPPLRRPPELQRAAQAFRLVADPLVVFPQHVHGADQPVFVGGIELDEIAIVGLQLQNLGPEQRNVVVMNYVKLLAVEDLEDGVGLGPGHSRLLGHERRQKPDAASQAVHGHVGMIGKWLLAVRFGASIL